MSSILQKDFGNIDIYLFDQLLKGTYNSCKKVLDAGCGGGRNLVYLLQNDYDVYAVDPNSEAIEAVKTLAKSLSKKASDSNFSVSRAEELPFEDQYFDLVICNAVLHFADSEDHFDSMLHSMWRVLKPGGFFFSRLASDIGIEHLVQLIGNGRYFLPDGSERFLVNEQMLINYAKKLNACQHEPIKTTNVQNLRCMTTWCLQKQ